MRRQLQAIARRESGAFFHSAMAPVVLAGFLVLVGLFFTLFTFGFSELSLSALRSGRTGTVPNVAEAVFQPLIANMAIFLLFLLPAVTMRLLSEEYRSGRYDLVLSYPVADRVWIVGKFLSVMAVAALMILCTAAYFAVASWLGGLELGPLLAACIGLLLLAAVIAAWGLFFSSLFQYQVVSYVLAFAFVFLFYIIDGLEPHLPGELSRLAAGLSFRTHFLRFSWGVVDLRDLVFFGSWILVGLAAAAASLAGRRLPPVSRMLRWLPTLMLALLMVILNLVSLHYPLSWDWTRNKRYSLAPQTEQVLQTLTEDVEVTAFYQRLDPQRKAVEVLLRACRDHSAHFRFEMADPDRDLAKVEQHGVTSPRTVVVSLRERRKMLLEPDESPLINAVYRLATGTRPVVYHLLGHGEHRLDSDERGGYSAYAQLLADQGYAVRPLLLADAPEVPASADILVISAPKLEFGPAEITVIQEFVRGGGAVLALLDPGTPLSLAEWAAAYNVGLGDDFIVSAGRDRREFGVDARVVVIFDTKSYGEHDVTRGLPGQATFFPFAQSLTRVHAGVRGVHGEWLLRSDSRSWAEKDPSTIASGTPKYDEGIDPPGPVVFGAAIEVHRRAFFEHPEGIDTGPEAPEPELPDDPVLRTLKAFQEGDPAAQAPSIFTQEANSRLVFIGDSDFAANANLNLYGNRDLLLNTFGWLARERVLIERRARESVGQPVVLSVEQKELIGWGSILGWPLLIALGSMGLVVRHRRRR